MPPLRNRLSPNGIHSTDLAHKREADGPAAASPVPYISLLHDFLVFFNIYPIYFFLKKHFIIFICCVLRSAARGGSSFTGDAATMFGHETHKKI